MANLIFKGIYKTEDQLPKANLPLNAVKFREPVTVESSVSASLIFVIPSTLLICLFLFASYLLHGELVIRLSSIVDTAFLRPMMPLLLIFTTIIPHELIHAIALGKGVNAEFFLAPRSLSAFIISVTPITKKRFIIMSFLPGFILGWLPLLVWAILPFNELYSAHLLFFSVISILGSCGDYMNIFNAIRQMPKGSYHQHSGFNSYWHIPESETRPVA